MQNDWIKCIRQEINDFKWLPSKNARICSDHFCNKDYKGYDGERKVMLKKAFPCFQDIKKVNLSYLFNNFNKIVLNNYSQCHFINTTLKGGYKTLMQYSEISKYTILTFDLGDKKSPSNFPPENMKKKIPVNPKYKDVKATIDTGASMSKYLQKIEEIKQNYKFSKDEIFKRIKITTFVQLLVQVYKLTNGDEFDMPSTPADTERSVDGANADEDSLDKPSNASFASGEVSNRSTLLGVSQGIGEFDVLREKNSSNNTAATNSGTTSTASSNNNKQLLLKRGVAYSLSSCQSNCPFLLLDIRNRDEYDQCHIIPAISYSKSMLSRSVNYESQEMLDYKNKEGCIIIVYDEDEKIASSVATTLVQRGYDNIFMLSGGLKVASKLFPEGLITGTLPSSLTTAKKLKSPSTELGESTPKIKQCLEREDIDKLEIYLSNLSMVPEANSRMSTSTLETERYKDCFLRRKIPARYIKCFRLTGSENSYAFSRLFFRY
ncbi:hypothetical protein HELRODRAFT_193635 [Helobdella robusta]|uniref:Rhodanese domain-containing protein n=1 Tax=Helobdella robusta TaxID=6412 RepID=T1FV78_HELRO|nr:hypothetical protein HELRODRAFT_193635 [Helobdella robusta]ESN95094.1 hypothetical protein HELRODRAFT_193635 [Helobdella robusta]